MEFMNHNGIRGNAFFITLVSVALLGALTFVVGRQMSGGVAQSISDEKVTLYANEIINYSVVAQHTLEQMLAYGVDIEDLDIVTPNEAGFDTGNHLAKIYHPSGGGLNYIKMNADMTDLNYAGYAYGYQPYWLIQKGQNVEWTPSSSSDVIFSFPGVKKEICSKINELLYNDGTVVNEINQNFGHIFKNDTTNIDFLTSYCPSCENKMMYCAGKSGSTTDYVFYNVIYSR